MSAACAALLPGRAVIAISGPDRVKYLQGMITNDMRRLASDNVLYAGALNGQGKLICDFFLVADEDRSSLILLPHTLKP